MDEIPFPEQNTTNNRPRGYRIFLLVILFFSFYLSYLILFPFLDTLVLAILMASIFHPVPVYLVRQFRGRKNLAALCIVFIITFVIAIPVIGGVQYFRLKGILYGPLILSFAMIMPPLFMSLLFIFLNSVTIGRLSLLILS